MKTYIKAVSILSPKNDGTTLTDRVNALLVDDNTSVSAIVETKDGSGVLRLSSVEMAALQAVNQIRSIDRKSEVSRIERAFLKANPNATKLEVIGKVKASKVKSLTHQEAIEACMSADGTFKLSDEVKVSLIRNLKRVTSHPFDVSFEDIADASGILLNRLYNRFAAPTLEEVNWDDAENVADIDEKAKGAKA